MSRSQKTCEIHPKNYIYVKTGLDPRIFKESHTHTHSQIPVKPVTRSIFEGSNKQNKLIGGVLEFKKVN